MNNENAAKAILFWTAITIISGLFQRAIPFPGISPWASLPFYVAAAYVFFRGLCLIINNSCVWILTKWGGFQEKTH